MALFLSITACWMTVIHTPFNHFTVTLIGLGYYMILKLERDRFPADVEFHIFISKVKLKAKTINQ